MQKELAGDRLQLTRLFGRSYTQMLPDGPCWTKSQFLYSGFSVRSDRSGQTPPDEWHGRGKQNGPVSATANNGWQG